ncbi:peroxisomal biogenesis factor 11 [Catenaria anguillulae PL171]|uniref:Peroxisomal biogenesis factor 11 n=1 Tax=Catenaria anguillulae PL171 TaxID=765915 RepID=A0A1Y2HI13_9FUNG|nr:peroxisomal biogenesis factor 11 [Catenaria anguillulae PL171]
MDAITAHYEAKCRKPIVRFSTLIGNVYGLDKVFRILVYSLSLLEAYLRRRHGSTNLAPKLKALVTAVSDTRIAMRMFGTLPSIDYALVRQYNPTPLIRLQNATMVIYHPCELMYWLGAHKIVTMSPLANDRWSRACCIAWSAWIVLELWSLWGSYKSAKRAIRDAQTKEDKAKAQDVLKDVYLRIVAQACDLPMAIHWSLPSYPLPAELVSLFGVVGGLAGGIRMWNATSA